MKTKPMKHQEEGQRRLDANPELYGLGAEQGTGKTWMLLNDAERQFASGNINGCIVLAPKGVHANWVLREIPTHMSVPVRAAYYVSGMGAKKKAAIERLLRGPEDGVLTVLAMNIDAVNTPMGRQVARQFLEKYRAMMAIDESHRIKNPDAERTKHAIALGRRAVSRRIASGTMSGGSPLDLFAQFEFLAPGRGLLGTKSYRAFVAEYAEVLPSTHPMVADILRRTGRMPQIVNTDALGRPVYKNIAKLHAIIEPYVYRVLKKDCLDLPEKIYQTILFELEPAQQKVYDQIKEQLRYERDCGTIDKFNALTVMTKLRQVTSGFLMLDGVATRIQEDTARLQLLREIAKDISGPFIVWASFKEELSQVAAALRADGLRVVEYHGGTNDKDRNAAVDAIQSGTADVFVGQQDSGGIGLTLTKAETTIYYSNTFSLITRLQSEDRNHRIGTTGRVRYIDLAAAGTIDERIAAALQSKADVAAALLDGL